MAFLRIGDTGLDSGRFEIDSYRSLTITEQTSTTVVGDYRAIGQPGYVVRFIGSGIRACYTAELNS